MSLQSRSVPTRLGSCHRCETPLPGRQPRDLVDVRLSRPERRWCDGGLSPMRRRRRPCDRDGTANESASRRHRQVDPVQPIPTDNPPIQHTENDTKPPAISGSTSPGAGANNPVRISRVGSDHLQVFVRPAYGCRELMALVERLEQLIGAGYDAIDVVFEAAPRNLFAVREKPTRPRDSAVTRNGSGTSTDAKAPPLARP